MKNKKFSKKITTAFAAAVLAVAAAVAALDLTVVINGKRNVVLPETLSGESGFDCIIVLGAGINGNKPSAVLRDRLDTAKELYDRKAAPKIIVSGDHGTDEYDEVSVMKDYLVSAGVPSTDVFMDHAGFSTYDSIYRARDVFLVEKPLVVTQRFHIYRALYIARKLGLDVYGVEADRRPYSRAVYFEIREIAARCKDAVKCVFKPLPKYLGETIPLEQDGDATKG